MADNQEALRLLVALGIGLLVGLERERRMGDSPARGAAGIRTFALAALLGGVAMVLDGTVALAIAGGFVVLAAILAYALTGREDPGMTTEVALVATFLLGALAQEEPVLASGVGVVTTVLLASRSGIHRFVQEVLTEGEVHDLLLLAAAAVVVLPLLPNEPVGPYDILNPFRVWRLVVLVMGIGGTGYVSLRLLGPRFGIPVAGLAGGFISSAATIGSMGSLARRDTRLLRPAVAGAVLSTVATIVQMAVVLATSSFDVLGEMTGPLIAGGLAALAFGGLAALRLRVHDGERHQPGRAFDLRGAVIFAAIVSAVLVACAALNDAFGETGVLVATGLAGFADAHAAATSAAALVAQGKLSPEGAVLPILAGLTTNTITKAVAALVTGGRRFAYPVWGGLAAVLAALWAGGAVVWLT